MSDAVLLLTAFVTSVLLAVALPVTARRLLGLPVSRPRAVLTSLAGLTSATLIGLLLRGLHRPLELFTITLGTTLLISMGFLAVLEVFVPRGSVGALFRLPRAMRSRGSRVRRYLSLIAVCHRHGLTRYLWRPPRGPAGRSERLRLAPRLRLALEDGGATFVKIGQLLATRYDLVPVELIDELNKLHDQAAPEPWETIEPVLRDGLGACPDDVFAEFDRVPVAAGSIAQVHRARLRGGGPVAVKVQRSRAQAIVLDDLNILERFAAQLEKYTAWGRAVRAQDLARGFAASLHEELDFRVEAENTLAVAAVTDPDVLIPAVHEPLSSRRVLVTEWFDGVPLTHAAAELRRPGMPPPDRIARALLSHLLRQIMVGGTFHADPHPGNLLLLPGGRVGMLDFGSVGRLDRATRSALREFLLALHREDAAALCDALLGISTHPEDLDQRDLERALARFHAKAFSGRRVNPAMISELFLLLSERDIAVPPAIAAVFRSLLTVEGTLRRLDTGFDVVAESRRFARRQQTEQLRPEPLARTVAEEALTLVPMLRRLPRRLDRIGTALESGNLTMRVRVLANDEDRRFVRTLIHEALLTFLASALGLMGVLLLRTDGGPSIAGDLTLFALFGYNILLVSAMLVLRVLFMVLRPER